MDFLAIWFRGLLEFFTQRLAVRQEVPCQRRPVRRDLPEHAPLAEREAGFGWMNVASVYEPRRAGPASGAVRSMLDNRATRRGG